MATTVPEERSVKKQRRHRHSPKEWDDLKEYFAELYSRSDKSLEDARRIIKEERGFDASIRQYKIKIKEWGLGKNFKASDMRFLAAKRDERERDRGVGTVFLVKGMKLDEDRLERFRKRNLAKIGNELSTSTTIPPDDIEFCTPRSTNSTGTPSDTTYDSFILRTRHHYHNLDPIITIEVRKVKLAPSTKDDLRSRQHVHQVAVQGIACRGQFAKKEKAAQFLWQARNLAISLDLTIQEPKTRTGLSALPTKPTDSEAPQFWVSSRENDQTPAKIQRLIGHVKQSKLCQDMLGLGRRDRAKWLNRWSPMDEQEGSAMEIAARHLFKDPAIPYPEMTLLTLCVRFSVNFPRTRPTLLRVCLANDPKQETQCCDYCTSTCMILDFMDSETAVKIHTTLSGPSTRKICDDWRAFSKMFATETRTQVARWNKVDYLYQGISQMSINHLDCKSRRKVKKGATNQSFPLEKKKVEEDFDENAVLEQCKKFEPFPTDSIWHMHICTCGACPGMSDEDSERDDRIEEGLGSDEESFFDPFPSEDDDLVDE